MKRIINYFLLLAVLASSCIGFNKVRVRKTNFGDEVQRAQNLVFAFSKDLIGDTSMLNKWDTTAYVRFEPNIAGRFMWTGKNELTFSPSGLLAPSTDYKAILLPVLLKHATKSYSLDGSPISFHTPYLAITGTNAYWALSSDPLSRVEVHLQVVFNCPVSPSRLKQLLNLKVKGKEIPFDMITSEDGEVMEVAFLYDSGSPLESADGQVTIAKGLQCTGGNVALKEAISASFSVPSRDKLEITEISAGFDQGKGVISVFISHPVIEQGLAGLVSVDPETVITAGLLPNGFTITGDFKENQGYTLRISPALKSVFGRELGQEYMETVVFGTLEPFIGFEEKYATYISSRGNRNLAVNIVNIPSVKVSVFKVFENNIQHYVRQGKSWDYIYEDEEYYDQYGYSFDENYGKPVFTKVIQTRSLPKSGNFSLLNLDPEEMQFNDPYKGIYVVNVESTDKRWLRDSRLLSLSDLGMIVKQGASDVMVFVNSLKDATPVKGAKVDFISSNNQKVYSAISDQQGVAVFRNVKQAAAGFRLNMVSVRYDDDFNYLLFDQSLVETSRFEVGGKRTGELNYDVFLYGDRNLYRPGDTVNVNAIVRTLTWGNVSDIPVKMKLISPNGKEYQSRRLQLNGNGAAAASFFLPRQTMTGTYTVEVLSANDVLLASSRISVEEFVPDRIKATLKTDKNEYLPGEAVQVSVLAENLYGTPAADKKVETELRLTRKNLRPAAYPDYDFTIQTVNMPVLVSMIQQGVTDPEGKSVQSLKIGDFRDIGLLEGSVFTTVFDETGRPVNRLKQIAIPTQKVFFGIKNFDRWVSTKKPLIFRFLAVDKSGKPFSVPVNARVEITRFKYETVIERGYNRYNYISQKKKTVLFSKEIVMKGSAAEVPFSPVQSGEYEVKILIPGSENHVSATFYAYGWETTDYSSFEVSREGEIIITCDKKEYKPGEKARLLFRAPFDGRLLVTMEQNNVLEYKYLELKDKSASLELEVQKAQMPNVYVDATAFHKTSDAFMPLTVAHGIQSIRVNDPGRKLKVSLKVPDKSRSGTKQLITLTTAPNAEVTLAVVDEGILQVTDFKTPDPYSWFYSKRALEVMSYDVYGQLYPEIRAGSSVAGGEAFDLSRRINPLTGERVRLISRWSGILRADASGTCTYLLDIPQFSGALRVMAVAYKDNTFGSADQLIRVADPVVISMALPRFLSPADQVKASVSLSNTTRSGSNATIDLHVSDPVQVVGKKSKKLFLKAGEEQSVGFDLQAASTIGNANVKVVVNSMGQKFTHELTLPVRPAAGLSYVTGSGAIKAGSARSFRVSPDMLPGTTKSTLLLMKAPAGRFTNNLNRLLRYPYGCLEQTISTAFPQMYFRDFIRWLRPEKEGTSQLNPDHNVQQAIFKVESMQLYNGGFSLWESGGNADWWPSAYAVHFLWEARKAGFETNRKVLDGGLGYLEQKVKEREMSEWFYFENNVLKSRKVPRQEIFYSLYVLALADRPSVSAMNFYKSQVNLLAPESKYLLASSYLLSGDRKSYQMLLPKAFGNEKAEGVTGGYYGSYIRDVSVALNALLEADPNHPQVAVLMKEVSEEMEKPGRFPSTQEDAFALLAMGKFMRRALQADISASVTLDGKPVATFKNENLKVANDISDKTVAITSRGSGMLYYSYEVSGIPRSEKQGTEDNFLRVRKRYLDRNGNEFNASGFRQNDLVVVEISAEASYRKTIQNVAITDLLPACFEIENSRLVAEREMKWMNQAHPADYVDIRDDRISFFTTLSERTSYFYYTCRVVSRGAFTAGPVSADAMYNGDYHSWSGSGIVRVE